MPHRPANTTSRPSCAIHAAWVAAEPPGSALITETVSLPRTTGPAGLTRMSLMMSPQTTARGRAALTGTGNHKPFGECLGYLGGECDVCLHQAQVDFKAGAAGDLQDAVEQERSDLLAADAGRVGIGQRRGESF